MIPKISTMKTVIEEWDSIEPPPPPDVRAVTVNPQETALLILDIQTQNCGKRPRCTERIPHLTQLLARARESKMLVVYSLIRSGQEEDILKEVKPEKGEPVVKSGVDKFYQTDLDTILKENNIKTVIITGTSAHGAVLHTATGAAARNYTVIIPVDTISSGEPYAEQYTVWHMMNAPGTRNHATITRTDLITIEV